MINSVGPKPTPGYQPAVNTVGPKPPRDFQVAHNSVGPKLPPGYTYPTSGVGPKPPDSAHPAPSGVGPKPPRGYTFSAGPKLGRNLVLPVTPAPAPVSTVLEAPLAAGMARAHARAQVHGRGQDGSQVRAHASAQAGDRAPEPWGHFEKEVKAAGGHKPR